MKTLDRYIGQAVTNGVAIVLLIFIVLYELLAFTGETGNIGRADYTVWSAIEYSLYLVPQHIYELFPLSMLLGTMLGLGWLANHNELVIIRMAGVSLMRIIWSIMKTAVVLMALAMLIGEGLAPPLHQYASEKKVKALHGKISLNTDYGLWARDGETYIHVARVENDGRLIGITLYQFKENNFIEKKIYAKEASYIDDSWLLKSVTETLHKNNSFVVNQFKTMPWKTLLNLDTVKVVAIPPRLLSVWKLNAYIDYLKNNELEYAKYELIYWTKLFGPLTILAMVLLAVPFIFGSVRQVSIGKQILLGFLVGVAFYIVSRLIGQVSLVYGVPAVISALLPTIIVIMLTLWSYRKIR